MNAFDKTIPYIDTTPVRMISDLVITPDGGHAVVLDSEGAITIWDTKSGKKTAGFSIYEKGSQVFRMTLLSNGQMAFVRTYIDGRKPNVLELWDLKRKVKNRSFDFKGSVFERLRITSDNSYVYASDMDNVFAFNLITGEYDTTYPVKRCNAYIMTPDNKRLLIIDNRINPLDRLHGDERYRDQYLLIADVKSNKIIHEEQLAGIYAQHDNYGVTSNNRYFISQAIANTVIIYNLFTNTLKRIHVEKPIMHLHLSPDSKTIIAVGYDKQLSLYDIESGQLLDEWHDKQLLFIDRTVMAPDGKVVYGFRYKLMSIDIEKKSIAYKDGMLANKKHISYDNDQIIYMSYHNSKVAHEIDLKRMSARRSQQKDVKASPPAQVYVKTSEQSELLDTEYREKNITETLISVYNSDTKEEVHALRLKGAVRKTQIDQNRLYVTSCIGELQPKEIVFHEELGGKKHTMIDVLGYACRLIN